jgi:hypothetical protein
MASNVTEWHSVTVNHIGNQWSSGISTTLPRTSDAALAPELAPYALERLLKRRPSPIEYWPVGMAHNYRYLLFVRAEGD